MKLLLTNKLTRSHIKFLKLGLRITFLMLLVHWVHFYLELCEPEIYNIYTALIQGLVFAFVINAALWISTLTFGMRHKVLTIFLLIPSLLFNTVVLETPLLEATYFSVIFSFIIQGITFFVLFTREELTA